MIVIARKYGQLGNRLFLYAHLIAAARHYGIELRNPCFAEYADLFPSTRRDLWCRYDRHLDGGSHQSNLPAPSNLVTEPIGSSQAVSDESGGQIIHGKLTGGREALRVPSQRTRDTLMHSVQTLTKSIHTIGLRNYPAKVIRLKSDEHCDLEGDRFRSAIESGRTLLLQGWLFRSLRLLNLHWPHIRDFFTVSMNDQAAIDSTVDQARCDCDVLVGVHIRRGDYAEFLGGRYFYDDQLYARWMRDVCEQLPGLRVRFLVCSHESLDQDQFTGLNITFGPGTAIRDMYALAKTDWMMGPPSTFTAWAAYMGGKRRIELQSKDFEAIVPPEELRSRVAGAPASDTNDRNRYTPSTAITASPNADT